MRLVSVCKVLDEADIIEAFARHTAHYAAHQIFLDNGSVDGTVEILKKLRQEGLGLTILQNGSRWYNEAIYNTLLYQRATARHAADWVAFFDADEFIDDRNASLRDILETTLSVDCIRIKVTNYHPTHDDDPRQLVVPLRVQWVESRTNTLKSLVRGNLTDRVIVHEGSHRVETDGGEACSYSDTAAVYVAHYPERSPFQTMLKFVRGWSRVLAAGTIPPASTHYPVPFTILRDRPEQLLCGDWIRKFHRSPSGMEHDPIIYRGDSLRYTQPQDEMMRAIRAMVGYLELLSKEHGRLLDECPGARKMLAEWAVSLHEIRP